MTSNDYCQHQAVVQLEIEVDKLEALFNKGELCAADVHCLNSKSKMCIQNLCLTACARRLQRNSAYSGFNICCKQHTEIRHKRPSI